MNSIPKNNSILALRYCLPILLLVGCAVVVGQQPAKSHSASGQLLPGVVPQAQRGVNPANLQPRVMNSALIDEAVSRGVNYLRQSQNPVGSWGSGTNLGDSGGWAIGYTALTGLALVECGVPKDDPGLRKALKVIRDGYPKIDSTYEVSLAILFLDRMGDPQDKPKIQSLAVRLIGGQTGSGGWAYKVPIRSSEQHKQILSALQKMDTTPVSSSISFRERPSALGLCIKMSDDIRPRSAVKGSTKTALETSDPEKAKLAALAAIPASLKGLPVFRGTGLLVEADPADRRNELVGATSDNSNTHFAAIALWAARRHEVPTERALSIMVKRFRKTQGENGSWSYDFNSSGGGSSMTCVALLAMAIGHAIDLGTGPRPEQDPIVIKAFGNLIKHVGAPTGIAENRPTVKDSGGLYYFWALERIAVIYDVSTFDNKDWYQWGAEILISHQQPDGSWLDGGYPKDHPILNTAFALLFLKRANLTPDLSKKLTVNSAALTASVTPTPPPKLTPTSLPPLPVAEPPPPPVVETPKVQPITAVEPIPVMASTPVTPVKSSLLWLWILLAIVGLLLLGLVGFLFFRTKEFTKKPKRKSATKRKKSRDDDIEAEDQPSRKESTNSVKRIRNS